jgi:hypothetical protein
VKLLVAVVLSLFLPAVVGSAAGAGSAAPHTVVEEGRPAFWWVPPDGFPDRFPFGQCTWWAAYNRKVTWNGNAGDWLVNARAQGVLTNSSPSVGAIVVYRPGGDYSTYGHVAIVIEVTANSYTVSEMNAVGWGRVSTRTIGLPDAQVQGFIPLSDQDSP